MRQAKGASPAKRPAKGRDQLRFPISVKSVLPALSIALLVSLLSWAILSGPLRATPLATLDRSLADEAMRLGADQRVDEGPTVFLVDYDQAAWTAAEQPAKMPAGDLLEALAFARRSGARLVILDLALAARSEAGGNSSLEGPISEALSGWNADPTAPLLLIADASGTGWSTSGATASFIARLGKVAFSSAVVRLGDHGEARSMEAWACYSASGAPVASPLPYLAALETVKSPTKAKQLVSRSLHQACAGLRPALTIGARSFGKVEPIFFHLSGNAAAVSGRSGRPALARRSFAIIRDAVQAGPSSRECPGRIVYMTDTCDSILVIGATHSGATDRFATPLSSLAGENSDPMMAGPLVLGNAVRGYAVYGLAGRPGALRSAVLLCVSLLAVFVLFNAWQLPYSSLTLAKRSKSRRGRLFGSLAWAFGPVVAKFAATTVWSLLLLLWYYFDLKWAFGPGLIVASYAPALSFAVLEVQQLESGEAARR